VVFTGHETKLMMNSTSTPVKSTKVEKMINEQIIFLFLCLIVIATLGALGELITEVFQINIVVLAVFSKYSLDWISKSRWIDFSSVFPKLSFEFHHLYDFV
jgi:magnesium-transporting ATPase (P-type)